MITATHQKWSITKKQQIMILLTYATGDIGQKLCRLLVENEKPFRAMCWKEEQTEKFRKQVIVAIMRNFENLEELKAAVQNCNRLFLITPLLSNLVQWKKTLLMLSDKQV